MPSDLSPAPGRAHGDPAIDQAGESRSRRIESLRAVAALGVLVGHVFVSTRIDAADTFLDRLVLGSGFGVYLFFTLSGYLLFWPFAKRDFGAGNRIDLAGYARNRALRILPLYLFVLAVLLVFQEGGGTLRQWVVFATFSENFFDDTFNTVDGVMWSLVVELHFYALLPLLAAAIGFLARGSLRRAAWGLGLLAAISLALRTATVTLVDAPQVQLQYSILTLFFFFVSGMMLALLRLHLNGGAGSLRGLAGRSDAWFAAGVGVWVLVCWSYELDSALALGGFLLVGACVLPLRPGVMVRIVERRALATVGVASYSLYLWHGPLTRAVYGESLATSGFFEVLLAAGALCLIVAFASYWLVESPFLRLRRRWAATLVVDVPSAGAGEQSLVGHAVAGAGHQPASGADGERAAGPSAGRVSGAERDRVRAR